MFSFVNELYRMKILIGADSRFFGNFYQFKIEYLDIASLKIVYVARIQVTQTAFLLNWIYEPIRKAHRYSQGLFQRFTACGTHT